MELELKHVNSLPARTWNRLGINETQLEETVAWLAPYGREVIASDLPAGVTASPQPLLLPKIETGMGAETADFVASQRTSGVALRSAAGTRTAQPVFLSWRLDAAENPAVVDENAVVAEEGSEITVVMSYRSEGALPGGFHGGLTRLYAAKGATIHLMQVQMLGDGCVGFDDVGAYAEEGAKIDVVQAELGGGKAFSGCKTRLNGPRSRLDLNAIYFGNRDRSVDINYVAEHVGRKTRSEIHVSGALLDRSGKNFRGTIDFRRGAKQAVGHESEFNLLFSPKVRSRTAPLILCTEEDVEGQHAASTGKIDENRMFYLMSRGLSELDAKKLLIEAQFRPVTERIPDEKLRAEVSDYVKERLSGLESLS